MSDLTARPSEAPPESEQLDARPAELGFVGGIGAVALDLYYGGRELYSVFVRTLYYTARGKKEKGALLAQLFEIGNRSVVFISLTMGFIGMILVYQSGLQLQRVVPDYTLLGATYP